MGQNRVVEQSDLKPLRGPVAVPSSIRQAEIRQIAPVGEIILA